MILTKIIATIWKIILIFLILEGDPSSADPGADFLSAVIEQLKQEKFPNNYAILHETMVAGTRRSVQDYQINESPETSGNSLDSQNDEYQNQDQSNNYPLHQDQNQNYPLNQDQNDQSLFPANQNQNYVILEHPVMEPNPFADTTASQQQENYNQVGEHQSANTNGYFTSAGIMLLQNPNSALDQNSAGAYENGDVNVFGSVQSVPIQYNLAGLGVNDPQVFQNNAGQAVHNQHAPENNAAAGLIPSSHNYYYHPTVNTIDENNLIDMAINAVKNENYLAGDGGGYGVHDPAGVKTYVVEPLFVAMAGFVGIAMIFMSAVLFLPKLLTSPPLVKGLKGPQELAALTKLAVEAIEGNDCTERIACEVGRAMRSMQVGSEPIKMIEVILPANMAKQLAQIRKAVASKQACKLIQCKRIGTQELKSKSAVNKKAATQKMEPKITPKTR